MRENLMRNELERHDELYAKGVPEISDVQYDKLRTLFRQQYPNSPYNNIVGASVDGDKVKLPFVLGSLTKVKTDGSCQDFLNEKLGFRIYWAKLDGVSACVQYVDGVYNRGLTRGDGEYGTDITEKLRGCVPAQLTEPVTGSYRAEVMLVGDVYKTLPHGDEIGYKTRRNGCAGILNRDGVEQCEHLVVLFYELIEEIGFNPDYDDESTRINHMRKLGLPLAPYVHAGNKTDEQLVSLLTMWKEQNAYDIDGLVIVRDDSQREDAYYPDDKCAFKVNEDATICDVSDVTLQVGRTGRVVPIINIVPTIIGGVTISNATGFNMKFVYDNGIGLGAKIGIYRSGDVIPYIDFVQESVELDIDARVNCPSCGASLSWKGVDMVCNAAVCPDRDMMVLEHFLTTLGCENVTSTTLKKISVRSVKDLYELDEFDISTLDGFGIKRAQQIIFEINKTLKTTPAKLLASFGISGIGTTAAQNILKVYGIEEIWTLTKQELLKVDGVGEILADNFFYNIGSFVGIYEYMKEQGLKWETASNSLRGQTFCLTGNGEIKRDVLVKMIESNGGYVKGMSKKVDYLVTNDPNSQTGKAKKCREYGKPVISYEDLMVLLEN